MTRVSKLLAATAIVAAGFAGQAHATLYALNGTTSLVALGNPTVSGGSVDFGTPGIAGFASGSTGDLTNGTYVSAIAGLSQLFTGAFTYSTTVGANGGVGTFSLTFNNGQVFTPSSITTTAYTVTGIGPTASTTIGEYFFGSLTNDSNSASFTLSLTSTGGSAFSASGTLATPAVTPPTVPEPMSMSILGLGLAGLAAARRRRA